MMIRMLSWKSVQAQVEMKRLCLLQRSIVCTCIMQRAAAGKWKLVECEEIGIGGMKNVTFMITGQGAYSVMKYESGVHRVQRVPETESGGRIHTSDDHCSSDAGS